MNPFRGVDADAAMTRFCHDDGADLAVDATKDRT